MSKKIKPKPVKKKKIPFDFIAGCTLVGLLLLLLTIYFIKRIDQSEEILIPFSMFAIVCGLIYEYKRICETWIKVLLTGLVSFVLSFFAFIPGKREHNYNLDTHIFAWPYVFCFFFILSAIVIYDKKTTMKLTEGVTLLQSIAIIYWVLDKGALNQPNAYVLGIVLIGLIYSFITIVNAFSYNPLSPTIRFHLSIWSSVIMAVLALDNIYRLYSGPQIENTEDFYQSLFIFIQYFFLGVSGIYIVQNFYMLFEFLPNKNSKYKKDYKELRKKHIERYSTEQIKKSHALACIIFTSVIFALNYKFKFVPGNFVIWFVFVVFPLIIHAFNQRFNTTQEYSTPTRKKKWY